jgi:hypothetical protein
MECTYDSDPVRFYLTFPDGHIDEVVIDKDEAGHLSRNPLINLWSKYVGSDASSYIAKSEIPELEEFCKSPSMLPALLQAAARKASRPLNDLV